MEINEHGKLRQAIFDNGYEYSETMYNELGDASEYFSVCYYSDYSFMYANFEDTKDVGRIVVEMDSLFYRAFETLLEGVESLEIQSDFSERFLIVSKNSNGDIEIEFHLLENETDGLVNIKNVMYDLRSKADQDDTDIKARVNKFFSYISHIIQNYNMEEKKKLELE